MKIIQKPGVNSRNFVIWYILCLIAGGKAKKGIVQKSGVISSNVILEIGPGTGNFMKKLLEAGKKSH